MPELPEVETIRRILRSIVIGKTISEVEVLREKTIISDVAKFKNDLIGATIEDIDRKGKFLIFLMSNNLAVISHLRMEGKFYLIEESEPNTKYARVVFHFIDKTKLCFDDSRCFGILKLVARDKILCEKAIKSLGLEPFDITDVEYLIERNKKNSRPIKSTLLDQTLIAGLGNIYSDEVLFLSGINPMEKAKDLTKSDWETIVRNSVIVLDNAIKDGGSTIHSYHPAEGVSGNFQTKLNVYGKKGEECPNCGHELYYKKINGRGTTYCPVCQEKLHPPISIGLTGPISSGKSTVLAAFKKLGCDTLSCDEVVHELYKKPEVVERISKITGLTFGEEVNRKLLREHIQKYPKDLERIDKYIHPLVRKEVIKFLNSSKTDIVVVEVPLLFEAHFYDLFDVTLALQVPEEKQLVLLGQRSDNPSELLTLNGKENAFYAEKADYIITNDGDIPHLNESVKAFLDIVL